MEVTGNIQQIAVRIPQAHLPAPASTVELPKPRATRQASGSSGQDSETVRMERLKNAARNAPQPLGSQAFTMFKDATGQVITRFRDTNSGRVIYIPEPNLLRLAGAGSGSQSLLNIEA